MDLNDNLPKSARRFGRAAFYGLAACVIFPMAYNYLSFNSAQAAAACLEKLESPVDKRLSPLDRTKRVAACIQERGGMVARWQMGQLLTTLESFPNAPCRYVGVWTSARPTSVYRVTLKENGEFSAEPVQDRTGPGDPYRGSWSVTADGRQMAWFYENESVWPPDINPIEREADRRFTLVERDGTRTQFDLVRETESDTCPRRSGS
jgi:hypothetical protein